MSCDICPLSPEISHHPLRQAFLERHQQIAYQQLLEHGLRHLAWLVTDDDVVRSTLSDRWKDVLSSYVPEPFRNLA